MDKSQEKKRGSRPGRTGKVQRKILKTVRAVREKTADPWGGSTLESSMTGRLINSRSGRKTQGFPFHLPVKKRAGNRRKKMKKKKKKKRGKKRKKKKKEKREKKKKKKKKAKDKKKKHKKKKKKGRQKEGK